MMSGDWLPFWRLTFRIDASVFPARRDHSAFQEQIDLKLDASKAQLMLWSSTVSTRL